MDAAEDTLADRYDDRLGAEAASPPGRDPYPGTLASLWSRAVETWPGREFLVYEDSAGVVTRWTYAGFDEAVRELVGWLQRRGVEPEQRVHIVLPNHPAFLALWLGTSLLGATLVPSNPRAPARELRQHVETARPVLAIAHEDMYATYRQAAHDVPIVKLKANDIAFRGLRAQADRNESAVSLTTPASVLFTSGTTSAPKGVAVTQRNYAFAAEVMASAADLDTHDRQLVVLPLFHANAQYYSVAPAISVGAAVVLIGAFSASRFLAQAARHGVTSASLFAAPIRMILARSARGREGLRLRHCWYAQSLSSAEFTAFSRLIGTSPRQLYGMTETIAAVLTSAHEPADHRSMGSVTPGCSVEIRDAETFKPTTPGQTGEIVVGGERGLSLFAGYLDQPRLTDRSFAGRWFRTGDLAQADENGNVFFVSRRADILKVAGENVAATEIENVIRDHHSVRDVAVIGEADPISDQVPIAFVVLASGRREPEQLEKHCAAELAPFKRPRRFVFVDELPQTSVGKIQKHLLKPR